MLHIPAPPPPPPHQSTGHYLHLVRHRPSISLPNAVNNDISELSAERLNLYINRQQDADLNSEGRILDPLDQEAVNVTFRNVEPKTTKERWTQNFRIALPHVGLVFLSAAYTLLGAAIFHYFETPYETYIRNSTAQRVQALKDQVIHRLWLMSSGPNFDNGTSVDEFWNIANSGMNAVIKDVFIDYTRHYMTPDDIIYGTGPTKWSFGSSIFFSWTAITTIGYGHIVPLTVEGRISCLLYALFGIPLILVTIADMGRFLSGGIIWVHNTFRKLRKRAMHKLRCLCCRGLKKRRQKKFPKSNNSTSNDTKAISSNDLRLNGIDGTQTQDGNTKLPILNHLFSSKKRGKRKRNSAKKKLIRDCNNNIGQSIDMISDAGTFEDISEIHTQTEDKNGKAKSSSEDTHARADDLQEDDDEDDADDTENDSVVNEEGEEEMPVDDEDEYEPMHSERRVSVLFILVVMLGYTAGGACLMQLWERWKFVDAFYFCFVTVTTIGFGDIVPQNVDFLPATLCYIIVGLIITTMCIDLVGSEYIRDIHFYGRSLGRSFLTIGGKVVHLGEVFSYVAFLQKSYGLTPDQLDKLAQLPEEYLLDCLINGRQPDLNWIGGRPFIPPDIYYFKWIEQPRTLSFTSERILASIDSELDLNTSRCSTARTLTPREYYQRILVHYCKQMQQQHQQATAAAAGVMTNGSGHIAATVASSNFIGETSAHRLKGQLNTHRTTPSFGTVRSSGSNNIAQSQAVNNTPLIGSKSSSATHQNKLNA